MWGAILGCYIRQNQPIFPSWRLPCFNMEWFATGHRNSLIRQPCDFERDFDFVLLQLIDADTLNTQFKYREGRWHLLLKRLKCWQKSCAKFVSLLSKTYWIFRMQLHVHLKIWTFKFKLLCLLNRICFLIKLAGQVDWSLICKLCKFGKCICYNFRDIKFFVGGYFFGVPVCLTVDNDDYRQCQWTLLVTDSQCMC